MYISVILVATLVGYLYQLRTSTIFACQANFYRLGSLYRLLRRGQLRRL